MPAPLRDVSQEGLELIKSFEGIPDGDPSTVNLDAYLCPADVWTIGWGHALIDGGAQLKGAPNKARARALYPGGITREQAQTLLRADLLPRSASVCSLVKVPLDEGPFGALMAFVFNVGAANFGASTLLRRLNAGDFGGAADQFLVWDKARVNGVLQSLAGLTRRRRAERAMFLGEDWRAVAALRATRGRATVLDLLEVLPVPEMPAEDQDRSVNKAKAAVWAALKESMAVPPARKSTPGKRAAVKKTPAKKTLAKKAVAKKALAKKTPARKSVR